jgi:glycosyltransferase involved in cell wall biosynthesis
LVQKSSLVFSSTTEENFGYCVVEALALGTQVLVPNDYSHPEILENNTSMMYANLDEITLKLDKLLCCPVSSAQLKNYAEPYNRVLQEWIKQIIRNVE